MTTSLSYDEMLERSARIQKRADIYILVGGGLIGTTVFGLFGLPFFLYGLWQIKRAAKCARTIQVGTLARAMLASR